MFGFVAIARFGVCGSGDAVAKSSFVVRVSVNPGLSVFARIVDDGACPKVFVRKGG